MAVAQQRKTKLCPLPKGCGKRRRLTKFSTDNAKATKRYTYCSDCTQRRARAYRQTTAYKTRVESRRQEKLKARESKRLALVRTDVARIKRLCLDGEPVVALVGQSRLEVVDIDTAPVGQGQYRVNLWDGKREQTRILMIQRLRKGRLQWQLQVSNSNAG